MRSYIPMTNDVIKDTITSSDCEWESFDSEMYVSDSLGHLLCKVDLYVAGEVQFKQAIFHEEYEQLAADLFDYAMTPLGQREDDYRMHWALRDSEGQATDMYLACNYSGVVFIGERVNSDHEDDYGYATAMEEETAKNAAFRLGIAFDAFHAELNGGRVPRFD